MKYFTTTIFTILLMALSVAAFASNAAKTYEGSVILENGQTLKGEIEMLSPTLNEIKVKFIDDNGNSTVYKAKDVAAYSFIFPKYNANTKSYDDQVIEYVKKEMTVAPILFGPTAVLVERQVSGILSLYNFYVETNASSEAFTHNYLVERDGQMIELKAENYKRILQDLVGSYPALKMKVGEKGYGYKNIDNIIIEYNAFLAPQKAL
jgi:hypothetical protein